MVKKEKIFLGKAEGEGNPVMYVGSSTGRDGIHGATMASEELQKVLKSAVQRFRWAILLRKKLLLEAWPGAF